MINIVRYFFLFILIISFQRCANQNSDYDDLLLQFSNGDFNKALATIQNIKSSGPDDETLVELEILQAKMERIELDFSKNESRIKNELMPYFPNIYNERLREWEENKSLEILIING